MFESLGGLKQVDIKNGTFIVTGAKYINEFSKDDEIPYRYPYHWNMNGHRSVNEMTDIMAITGDIPASAVMTLIKILEHGLCTIFPQREDDAHGASANSSSLGQLSHRIVKHFWEPTQSDSQTYNVLRKKVWKLLKAPSPLQSALSFFLPHAEKYNFLSPVIGDSMASDSTGIYHALQAMDRMNASHRPVTLTVFDTTPHGELPASDPDVPLRDLFWQMITTLDNIGLDCSASYRRVPNPNYVFKAGTKNATILKVYKALRERKNYNQNFSHRRSEFEVRVPGGPVFGQRGPVQRNAYWGINGGWNFTLSKIDNNLAFFDDWFLERLPGSFSDALIKKGWPSFKGDARNQKLSMLAVQYVDAFSQSASGELRALFFLCLLVHSPDCKTGLTTECHKGGAVWENPHQFLARVRDISRANQEAVSHVASEASTTQKHRSLKQISVH